MAPCIAFVTSDVLTCFHVLLCQYSVRPNAYTSENLWHLEMINRFGSLTDVVCVSPVMFHIEHLPVRKVTTRSMPASPIIFPSPSLTGAPTMHALTILLSTFYTFYTIIHLCYKTNNREILPPPVGSVAAFRNDWSVRRFVRCRLCFPVMFHVESLPVRKVTNSIDARFSR